MTRPYRLLDEAVFAEAIARAEASPRLRTNHNLHGGDDDPVHRFLNVMHRGTYVTPHRHLSPAKTETFLVLRGRMAVVLFGDDGAVSSIHRLGDASQSALPCCIDLDAGLWHSVVCLEGPAICFEVKPGPWSPATDKDFAPFAPREGVASPEVCRAYLDALLEQANER
jgi:cupin fold WbuC family metalloprotein